MSFDGYAFNFVQNHNNGNGSVGHGGPPTYIHCPPTPAQINGIPVWFAGDPMPVGLCLAYLSRMDSGRGARPVPRGPRYGHNDYDSEDDF